MRRRFRFRESIGFSVLILATLVSAAEVSNDRVLREAPLGNNWFVNGGDFSGQHHSPLADVNRSNVDSLSLAWSSRIPAPDGIAGTPIVVDGVVYFSAAYSIVYALDAASGRQIWRYDPDLRSGLSDDPDMSWPARANRGVAVWGNSVFVAAADCRLIAIDAKTGRETWSVVSCDPELGYAITDAPRVGGGKVFIGNAGSESGEKNRGYVSAYAANDGRLLWRFYTVPSTNPAENDSPAMKMAAATWSGDVWQQFGGGGSVWNEMTYDPKYDLLYFGTGGSIPYLHRDRSPDGLDNLFLSSVLAIDASTGAYRWHYQTVPEESWDYNANMNIVLADLDVGGDSREVLMIAPKNGFFYVLDRKTGELLSAEKYATVNWASHINMETGRPVLTEEGKYWEQTVGKSSAIWPNMWGAHSWQPMAFHPGTGLVYIPVVDVPTIITMHEDGSSSDSVEIVTTLDGEPHAPGKLTAWDPVGQRAVWSVPHELPFNGGILTTAGGLIFQGSADGRFSAFDATNGMRLWSVQTGSPINSAPVSFSSATTQYILIAVGAGGGMQFAYPELHAKSELSGPTRVMAFALDGQAKLEVGDAPRIAQSELPDIELRSDDVARGRGLYHDYCNSCHGKNVRARVGGSVPDLRYSGIDVHDEWRAIVVDGSRERFGMPRSELEKAEAEAIRHYVLSMAYELREENQ